MDACVSIFVVFLLIILKVTRAVHFSVLCGVFKFKIKLWGFEHHFYLNENLQDYNFKHEAPDTVKHPASQTQTLLIFSMLSSV